MSEPTTVQGIEKVKRSRLFLAAIVPLTLVLLMWAVYLLDHTFDLGLVRYGLRPRQLSGTIGIFTSPFLHGGLEHLVNNSLPMLILGWCLFYFYPQIAWRTLGLSWLLTGLWVWISARSSNHIGASGLVYALAAFLFLSGVLRKHTKLMAISLLVTFVYGSLVWGVLPLVPKMSWESHLWGGVAGALIALYFRKQGPQRKRFEWEHEPEEDPLMPSPEEFRPDGDTRYVYHFKPRAGEEDRP